MLVLLDFGGVSVRFLGVSFALEGEAKWKRTNSAILPQTICSKSSGAVVGTEELRTRETACRASM